LFVDAENDRTSNFRGDTVVVDAHAKPQWEDRIRTAEAKGMEPLVEPTLAR